MSLLLLFLCLKKTKLPKCLYPEIIKQYNKKLYRYYGLFTNNNSIISHLS